MSELDPRQETILRAVIIEYVTGAEPIGSEALVQRYELGVRAATVRNEMAELSERGYLEQPHTSAGRIPSDQGYRYYVDRISQPLAPSGSSKAQLRNTVAEGDALHEMLRNTARALSGLTHLLTVAATVRDSDLIVRSALFSALGPRQALLVLALSNGQIENRLIECPPGLTLEDIGAANEFLASSVKDKTLGGLKKIRVAAGEVANPGERVVQILSITVRQLARDLTRGVVVTEGEKYMFLQPEFHKDMSKLSDLLDQLGQIDFLYEAVPPSSPQVVTIGREHQHGVLRAMSVVRHGFSIGDRQAGMIALIGPTRMNYDSSIPLVTFTAQALSDSLTKFFG